MDNKNQPRPSLVLIGKRLKEAREKKSLTIEQIQKATKIHSTVLKALEEGRANDILSDTYIRSFLKQYANYLGLPAAEIVKEYFPPHTESAPVNINFHDIPLPKKTMITPRALYITGMAALGIVAVFTFFFLGGKIIASMKKTKAAHQQKVVLQAPAAKKKAVKPAKKAYTKKKSPVNSRQKSKELVPKSEPLSLVIRVKEPVLVRLRRDGVHIFDRVMTKGLVETVVANNNIELEIGKSNALELVLNGRPISLPARKSIFTLVITRKVVKIK